MRQLSTKRFDSEGQEIAGRGKFLPKGARLARRWLQSPVAQPKQIAAKLRVSERTVYKWAQGEAEIPADRANQILIIARVYLIPLNQLRDETDLYLLAMNDPGNF